MFKKIGSALKRFGRKAKIAASLMSVAAVTAITTVIASAAGETTSSTSSSFDFASVISDAGDTIQSTLLTLVNTLAPTLVTISVSGLGIYAIIMLFTLAKKLFKKAAG